MTVESGSYIKRIATRLTQCADGKEVPEEGLGWHGIAVNVTSDGVWVKFPAMYTSGPFGVVQGQVQTLIPQDDLKSISAEEFIAGIKTDSERPKVYMMMGEEIPIDN